MATATDPLREPRNPAVALHWLSTLVQRTSLPHARARVSHLVAQRRERARLGMLGMPLAMTSGMLCGAFWVIPLLAVGAWWWSPREWGWEWLVAVGRGAMGLEWAYMGASALAAFPDYRFAVGVAWAALAALIAGYVRSTAGRRG